MYIYFRSVVRFFAYRDALKSVTSDGPRSERLFSRRSPGAYCAAVSLPLSPSAALCSPLAWRSIRRFSLGLAGPPICRSRSLDYPPFLARESRARARMRASRTEPSEPERWVRPAGTTAARGGLSLALPFFSASRHRVARRKNSLRTARAHTHHFDSSFTKSTFFFFFFVYVSVCATFSNVSGVRSTISTRDV